MRVCRICLTPDVTKTFESLFAGNGKIAAQLNSLFGIVILEILDGPPALICRKCEKHVLQASELRNLCKISEKHFSKDARNNEHFYIHENLRELRALTTAESVVSDNLTTPKVIQKSPSSVIRTTRSSSVHEPSQKGLRARKTGASRELTFDDPPAKFQKVEISPDPIAAPQIKTEEIEEDCDSTADTEVSDELAFIDTLTLDQIKVMTEALAEILMPVNEKPKKKKKKKNESRFIQRIAPTRFRIRMKRKAALRR